MKRIGILLLLLLMTVGTVACGAPARRDAAAVLSELTATRDLTALTDMTAELFADTFGLLAEEYKSAIYLTTTDGLSPEEVVIVEAVDAAAADRIEAMLADRLAYKENAAKQYLTEYLPIVQAATLTREGNTVWLVILADA